MHDATPTHGFSAHPLLTPFRSRVATTVDSPAAFTLVELLVTIGILALLLALLIPAVQAAREVARRVHCSNNIKQLGLGLNQHEALKSIYPPAVQMSSSVGDPRDRHQPLGPNWAILVLPFIEQQPLYVTIQPAIDDYGVSSSQGWRDVRSQQIPLMSCPSDSYASIPFSDTNGDWARGNYGANAGTGMFDASGAGDDGLALMNGRFVELSTPLVAGNGTYRHYVRSRGVLSANSAVGLASITDGGSNTVLLDEIRAGTVKTDLRGTWALGQAGASIVAGSGRNDGPGPNISLSDYDDIQNGFNDTANGMGCQCFWSRQVTAKSLHRGGVNVVFCDGHVLFLSDAIDQGVYQLLHSRDDRMPCTLPD